jgi:ketosteroid isomerase-like protein
MSVERNIQLVKDAYAAFVRGDIATIVDSLTDDVEWEGVKGTEGVLPHAGVRRGKAEVAKFFQQVGSTLAFDRFEPQEYVAQADTVVAIGRYSGTMKTSGRVAAGDWVMVFNLRDGKVARFREFTDSAALVRAHQGAAVEA